MDTEQRFATGPAPYSDVPPFEAIITHQLFSVSRRASSISSSHVMGAGNILDLFRHGEHDFANTAAIDDLDESFNEHTPLKHTHVLRNPLSGADPDLISSYNTMNSNARKDSLSTLKKIRSHNTIKHVISTGTLPDIETSTREEFKILGKYSFPLVITFLLQYSLNVASVFSVGKIGKTELAAVSLASMTANITGYCVFQGTSTSLDTLCAQAFGRKDYNLVGLHFLRCTIFLLLLYIPVSIFWIFLSKPVLTLMVDDERLVMLASSYLSVLSIGLPGFILFETCKKFLQAQNIFHASTYVILFAAPFNAFLNYYLVWGSYFKLGFIGAPIAIVCTNYIMASLLVFYAVYIDGYQCWCGFTKDALKHWGKMLSLSLNGCIGVLSEWLAFEILTLSAARFGTVALASQSVISTICILLYQIPFAISIASSTRIANFIGAASKRSLITATNAAIVLALVVGVLNAVFLTTFKYSIIKLFTADEEVIEYSSKIIPIGATYQINDCLAAVSGGILRGQGLQHIAAFISLFAYYLIALPIGFILAFAYKLDLFGLWIGLTIAIFLISLIQTWTVVKSDWDGIINESLQEALAESSIPGSGNIGTSHSVLSRISSIENV